MYQEERTINLWDMFWAICLKWRQIVIAMIIFAILAGGASYYKSSKRIEAARYAEQNKGIDEYEFSDAAKDWVGVYQEYSSKYQKRLNYSTSSILMQLNAQKCWEGFLTYYVDNHHTEEYPVIDSTDNISGISAAYQAVVSDAELLDEIAGAIGEKGSDRSRVAELVSFKDDNIDRHIVEYVVYGRDSEECKAILEILEKYVTEHKKNIDVQVGEHDLTETCNEIVECADESLATYQKTELNALNEYCNTLDKIKAVFSDEELRHIKLSENTQEEETAEDTREEEKNSVIEKPNVSKKMIVAGLMAGAILMAGIYFLVYLFDRRLRFGEAIERLWDIKVLGTVVAEKNSKKPLFGVLDRFLNRMRYINIHLFEEEEAIAMVEANIKVAMKNAGCDKVFITGNAKSDCKKQLCQKIREGLENAGIQIIEGNSILYDAQALEQAAETGNVIFVEQAEVSLLRELDDEVNTCRNNGINMVGTVVVD